MPRFRVMATPCLKALSEGAVIRTPCAPPPVSFFTAAAGSPDSALIIRLGAYLAWRAFSLPLFDMSIAQTSSPIALAY